MFRHGVKRLLTEALAEVVIAEAVDGPSAMALMRQSDCDLVLLDVTLPGPDGLEVLKDLCADFPHVPVLIVSMHPADQFARRMIAAGAVGYITKDTDPAELMRAVTLALKGQQYVPRDSHAGASER